MLLAPRKVPWMQSVDQNLPRFPGMSSSSIQLTPALYEYLHSVSLREPEILRKLREETAAHPNATMQISPEQGQFMAMLVRLVGATKILEVGVFTGYSSTVMALNLPESGTIDALDIDEDFTNIAKRYWKEARVESRVRLHLAPALDTLAQFSADGKQGTYDLAFIDADKANYLHYYNHCVDLVRPGGLVLVDNVLWGGDVADPAMADPDTEGIRKLNLHVHQDDRVQISMLPVGDGLTLARKL